MKVALADSLDAQSRTDEANRLVEKIAPLRDWPPSPYAADLGERLPKNAESDAAR